jgi:hypothetical protein
VSFPVTREIVLIELDTISAMLVRRPNGCRTVAPTL